MKKIKRRLKKVIISLVAFAAAMLVEHIIQPSNNISLIMFLAVYILVGNDVIKSAAKNITHGRLFDEQFLMTLATVCAFIAGEYPEGVAVMLFYQVGELFQDYAVFNSRKSISALMDIRPDYANVLRDGELIKVSPEEVHIEDTIVIKPGEKVPLDGEVIEGNSTLDTKALTGESLPRDIAVGEQILSGCINVTGTVYVKVTKEFGESTVSKILDLVENQGNKKAKTENFITKFARYYTPIVVICAVLLALIPPLVLGDFEFSTWIYRAMIFLVVSCPCALVISIPLSFFGGLGGASRQGVLVKGSNYLEAISKADTIIFDKTGTLTKGSFKVTTVSPVGISNEELIKFAAMAEKFSNHPIARSLREAYQESVTSKLTESYNTDTESDTEPRVNTESPVNVEPQVTDIEELAGYGITATVDSKKVMAGNARMLEKFNIKQESAEEVGTVVYVAIDGQYAGYIVIADEIREDTVKAITELKKAGVNNLVMLTGDSDSIAQKVVSTIGITKVYSELLPQNKVEKLEEIMQDSTGHTVFVGDGVNDAPVLARADVGIAMGGMGSDAAIEAADIVIMTDEPSKIVTTIKVAKKTLRIAKQNIAFALGIKFIVLILGAIGIATMWHAVFADVGVSVIAILNSTRAMRVKK